MNVFCIYIYVFNYLEVSEIIFLYTPVENVSSTLFLENICRGKITPHFQKTYQTLTKIVIRMNPHHIKFQTIQNVFE